MRDWQQSWTVLVQTLILNFGHNSIHFWRSLSRNYYSKLSLLSTLYFDPLTSYLQIPSCIYYNINHIMHACIHLVFLFTMFNTCRLEFPSVLILYQDMIVSIHGINVLIGFIDRRLFCTSEDLVETYMSSASPFCTLSGRILLLVHMQNHR